MRIPLWHHQLYPQSHILSWQSLSQCLRLPSCMHLPTCICFSLHHVCQAKQRPYWLTCLWTQTWHASCGPLTFPMSQCMGSILGSITTIQQLPSWSLASPFSPQKLNSRHIYAPQLLDYHLCLVWILGGPHQWNVLWRKVQQIGSRFCPWFYPENQLGIVVCRDLSINWDCLVQSTVSNWKQLLQWMSNYYHFLDF